MDYPKRYDCARVEAGHPLGCTTTFEPKMGIELRKGRFYSYDRRRVNGRMRAYYCGAVPPWGVDLIRIQAEEALEERELARYKIEQQAKWADDVLAAGEEFNRLADGVFRELMHLTGHTLHKRSEWRRTRGVSAMAETELASKAAKEPELSGVAERAAVSLLFLGAGKDEALLLAMCHKYKEYIANLLEDGPVPTYAERMAATRAAHNWMAVNILESKAALQNPASSVAMILDKRVTLAEKRLHASLKSLAVLRRLRKPVVVKQVNIAKGGPMQVNNGKTETLAHRGGVSGITGTAPQSPPLRVKNDPSIVPEL